MVPPTYCDFSLQRKGLRIGGSFAGQLFCLVSVFLLMSVDAVDLAQHADSISAYCTHSRNVSNSPPSREPIRTGAPPFTDNS